MRKALPVLLLLSGCAGGTPAPVCSAIAAAASNPQVVSAISSIAPQSALGQVWTYANSGCVGPNPAPGVSPAWTQQVWTMVQQLAPTVLPMLVGLL
jgi:hypothetical protein